jgi:hypothetical protein
MKSKLNTFMFRDIILAEALSEVMIEEMFHKPPKA